MNYSPAVWLHAPMGGIYAVNWPMARELAKMLGLPFDMEKIKVIEEELLKRIEEEKDRRKDGGS